MEGAKVIAFYLPQYHPIKENNEWYGEGFTEWTNVGKARPLFKGHYQPRVPADLGYYDLRLPEVRERQAELAKEAGISAFCYYHYWFGNGRMLMEKPLENVVKSQKPDFPFCICWANHSFYKKDWNPNTKQIDQKILMEQRYMGDEDYISHFNYLLPMFKDARYCRIDGRLPFVIYMPQDLPDLEHFKKLWNDLAIENGLPGFFFITYTINRDFVHTKPFSDFDGILLSLINNSFYNGNFSLLKRLRMKAKEMFGNWINRPQLVYDYADILDNLTDPIEKEEKVFPVICPNWDLSPRRGAGGLIFHNSSPELFKRHVRNALDLISDKKNEYKIIFLKSWNEWGEGNYMEPDLGFGKGYIQALREVLNKY